jgi:DNA-binding response OmpR family regulator
VNDVLVVDDDPTIHQVVSLALGPAGYRVLRADRGEEAVAAVESGFRGVLLLDVLMPGLDGWETIGVLIDRGLLEGIAVCMLTGCHEHAEGLGEYVLDYLAKPFCARDLLRVVEAAAAVLPCTA